MARSLDKAWRAWRARINSRAEARGNGSQGNSPPKEVVNRPRLYFYSISDRWPDPLIAISRSFGSKAFVTLLTSRISLELSALRARSSSWSHVECRDDDVLQLQSSHGLSMSKSASSAISKSRSRASASSSRVIVRLLVIVDQG